MVDVEYAQEEDQEKLDEGDEGEEGRKEEAHPADGLAAEQSIIPLIQISSDCPLIICYC